MDAAYGAVFLVALPAAACDIASHDALYRDQMCIRDRVMSDRETMTYTYYQNNVKPKPQTDGKKGFVCKVCGYIYEGDTLPDDIICPLCKHGAADFEPIE